MFYFWRASRRHFSSSIGRETRRWKNLTFRFCVLRGALFYGFLFTLLLRFVSNFVNEIPLLRWKRSPCTPPFVTWMAECCWEPHGKEEKKLRCRISHSNSFTFFIRSREGNNERLSALWIHFRECRANYGIEDAEETSSGKILSRSALSCAFLVFPSQTSTHSFV